MQKKTSNKKSKAQDNTTLIGLLLCLAILTLALYPVVFLVHLSAPNKLSSQNEYLATLLAHHATETLVAKRALDKGYLPKIANNAPVVVKINSAEQNHPYFQGLLPHGHDLNEVTDPVLFWAFNPFSFTLDNYLLDNNLFKAICKINYVKDGKTMQVFFERLLCPEGAANVSISTSTDSHEQP